MFFVCFFYRHRKVLEKVTDVDYVLKVYITPYIYISKVTLLSLLSSSFTSIFMISHPSLVGTDSPRVWRTLYLYAIWLQIMHRLLHWCQSLQEAAQNSCTHFVSQRCRWPLLSSKWWVKNRVNGCYSRFWVLKGPVLCPFSDLAQLINPKSSLSPESSIFSLLFAAWF